MTTQNRASTAPARIAAVALHQWLGVMFAYSSAMKLVNYRAASNAPVEYGIVPPWMAVGIGRVLPGFEGLAAIALLLRPVGRSGGALAAGLGLSFGCASTAVLLRGVEVPCGCAGSRGSRVSHATLARAALITGAGVFLTVLERRGGAVQRVPGAIPLAGLSMVPAALLTWRRLSHSRYHRDQARMEPDIIERLAGILEQDPASPEADVTSATIVDGASFTVSHSGQLQPVARS